jgi:hypothetical protein
MSDATIAQLSAAAALDGTEDVPLWQGGTRRATAAEVSKSTYERPEGWNDMLASISSANLPPANAPTRTAFQPGGAGGLYQYAFAVNDYAECVFHSIHDLKPGGNAYFHFHWTTNGTSTNTVKWQVEYSYAQRNAVFSNSATQTIETAASGAAYTHSLSEFATPITLATPDILIIATIKRITNGGSENANSVFGMYLDLHYEVDRSSTPNRDPDFYA